MVKIFYSKIIIMASTSGTVKVEKYEIENFNGKNDFSSAMIFPIGGCRRKIC